MKMIINKKLWVLGLLIPMFISCSDEEAPVSKITTFATIAIDATDLANSAPVTVGEGGTFTFEFSLGDEQIVPVGVEVYTSSSSTATEGVDYTLDTDFTEVETFGKGKVNITILPDLDPEGLETIYIRLTGHQSDPVTLADTVDILAFNVRDSIYTTPGMNMTWEGEIAAFPGNFWCSFIDIDMLIFDDAGNEVTGYVGATGNCVETATPADIPDGTYRVEANLWSNPITGNGLDNEILPLKLGVALGGVGNFEFYANDIGLTPVWTGDTPSDEAGLNNIVMGTITVNGNIMTLTDANGNLVGTVGSN